MGPEKIDNCCPVNHPCQKHAQQIEAEMSTTERERVRETCFAATEAVKRGDVEPGEAVRQIMEAVDAARLEGGEVVAEGWQYKWDDDDDWTLVWSEDEVPTVIRYCQPQKEPDLRGTMEPVALVRRREG